MKKLASILLVAGLIVSLGSTAFAAEKEEAAADTTAAAAESTEAAAESTEAAEAPAAEAAAETTAVVATAAAETPAVAAEAEEEEADPTKYTITFNVDDKVYTSKITIGNMIRIYADAPASITDEDGNKLYFNCWLTEDGKPYYPASAPTGDMTLTANYAFVSSFEPEYFFVETSKLNDQFAPKGPYANLTTAATDLTFKSGDSSMVKVIKADGGAKVYGVNVGTTYLSATDAETGTTAYALVVVYDAQQKSKVHKLPWPYTDPTEWNLTGGIWNWNIAPNSIPALAQ